MNNSMAAENNVISMDTQPQSAEKSGDATSRSYEENCVVFHGISYLGCITINNARNEEGSMEAIKTLRAQNANSNDGIMITVDGVLTVPNRADGVVRLLDSTGEDEWAKFSIYKIIHCLRGDEKGPERDCFAFTEAREPSGLFQCHVFKCNMPDAVRKILSSFEYAFQSIPKVTSDPNSQKHLPHQEGLQVDFKSNTGQVGSEDNLFCFNVSLEIREIDAKGSYSAVPWDKASSCFKLRKNLERQIVITISQLSNVALTIERCFGLLLAPGRNVRHSDMHLLDMESPDIDDKSPVNSSISYYCKPLSIVGFWHPSNANFALLNEETRKGTRVFLSFAVDLVVREIQEPVRLMLETKARIFPQNEKFWYFGKKLMEEMFFMRLKEVSDPELVRKQFVVVGIEDDRNTNTRLAQFNDRNSGSNADGKRTLSTASPQDEEDDDDMDEPLLSGSGEIKALECSEKVLTSWSDVLEKWRTDFNSRPNGLKQLVREGIPNALRGAVWQLLVGCHDNTDAMEQYRVLMTKESPQDDVIQRDVHRTFPAHDFFKEAGGSGQESLYRIGKAYSIYDKEVGYCQGLSFLAAALLLHMPEEQAFAVLCKIMYQYNMRELFKNGFKELRVKLFQLETLIDELIPELGSHFKSLSVDAHMYSSQWFLTLFTAKFPLGMVYRVIDLFLSEGEPIIFKVALGLLQCSRQQLLTLDFEGILKFFRVSLPKKYRSEESMSHLFKTAVSQKVTSKKLKKLSKAYDDKQEKLLKQDPHAILRRDNQLLMKANMRLEAENDELAEELNSTRTDLESQLNKTQQDAKNLGISLEATTEALKSSETNARETAEDNERLMEEIRTVKELCRKEMEKQELEIEKKNSIIQEYKGITSRLSQKLEHLQMANDGTTVSSKIDTTNSKLSDADSRVRQIQELELELARTKLSKVESECKVQELEHQLSSAMKELQSAKSTWLHKTISTFTSRNQDQGSINE